MAHQLTDDELSAFVPERLQVDWQESRTHPHCKWDADAVVDFLREVALCCDRLRQAQERIKQLEGRACLICGRSEPCELDKDTGKPDWPGSPCTFDPSPVDAARQFMAERDAAIERGRRACGELEAYAGAYAIAVLQEQGSSGALAEMELRAEAAKVDADAQRALAERRLTVLYNIDLGLQALLRTPPNKPHSIER